MLLALDIGNTNVTLGVFQDEAIKATWRMATDARRMADEYALIVANLLPLKGISPQAITDIAICSVVPPLTSVFEEVARSFFRVTPLVVGGGVKTGVRILYDPPRDVGADRVVDAAAAFRLYGGPVIIVDFGTATVFDAVTREGDYLGGAIAPGLNVAAESLFLSTSQLRRVELQRPKLAIGRNTIASMQSGLVFGHIDLVRGMVKRFKQELGEDSKVVATGGLAAFIAQEAGLFDAVNPDLTLIGLKIVYQINSS
ncbi:MAG: type III pantothenate kinase [Chloroflexi bacterium]|nr:type III pantothenate kinase [Chloroflexota bacterium]